MVCSTVYVECNERNITVKANILQKPLFICECPSSQSRNKAKNALSLAKSISPELAMAKIGKFSFTQCEKRKKHELSEMSHKLSEIKFMKNSWLIDGNSCW